MAMRAAWFTPRAISPVMRLALRTDFNPIPIVGTEEGRREFSAWIRESMSPWFYEIIKYFEPGKPDVPPQVFPIDEGRCHGRVTADGGRRFVMVSGWMDR